MRATLHARVFRAYVATVAAVGAGLFVWLPLRTAGAFHPHHLAELAVLVTLLTLSEQHPLVVQRRGERSSITLSAIFACAILLRWEIAVAVAAQAVASLVDDVRARRPWWKSAFNVAQYTIALATAGLVYHSLAVGSAAHPTGRQVVASVAAGGVFFAVDTILTGTAIAISEGIRLSQLLATDLGFQASVNGAMAGLSPLVVAVVSDSLWLVPLLLLPAIAVYQGARGSLEKEHRSRHDLLTELPNRLFFGELLGTRITTARRGGHSVGVMIMDIDGFKDLNDTLGHSSGDDLLCQVAARLAPALGEGETLARLGGDEFGILLPVVSGPDDAIEAARRMLAQLELPFDVGGLALDVRASVGIALFPDHGVAVDEVTRHADVAMYLAKRNRTGHEVYDPKRNEHSRRRLMLLNELRPAIAARSLVLHYQPKVDMRTGQICGLEALLRWPHPVLGMVPPAEFIGLAEQTALIRPLTDYVLEQAFAQMARWKEQGVLVPVAVNLSARVLHDATLPGRIGQRLAELDLPPHSLILELTETAVMAEPDRSMPALDELAAMGVRLSIDDFGTGYSSLSYLSRLPVSEIKIDRSFVTHLDTHEHNRAIVESTIELAGKLGLVVVAEGVETIPVWQTLARLGCATAQGYLIARPEPADVVTGMLGRGIGVPVVEEFAVNFGLDRSPAHLHAGDAPSARR
jgi:diguanylate cyclase (GGDEF)-like protein